MHGGPAKQNLSLRVLLYDTAQWPIEYEAQTRIHRQAVRCGLSKASKDGIGGTLAYHICPTSFAVG
jgi:hypothetical protein